MPTIARANGWHLVIYPHNHEPPHVHARRAEGEIRVAIGVPGASPAVQYGEPRGDLRAEQIREAVEMVADRQAACLSGWERTRG